MARYCNDYIKKALDVQAKVSNKLREALNKFTLARRRLCGMGCAKGDDANGATA
jgi:hypothetical protein